MQPHAVAARLAEARQDGMLHVVGAQQLEGVDEAAGVAAARDVLRDFRFDEREAGAVALRDHPSRPAVGVAHDQPAGSFQRAADAGKEAASAERTRRSSLRRSGTPRPGRSWGHGVVGEGVDHVHVLAMPPCAPSRARTSSIFLRSMSTGRHAPVRPDGAGERKRPGALAAADVGDHVARVRIDEGEDALPVGVLLLGPVVFRAVLGATAIPRRSAIAAKGAMRRRNRGMGSSRARATAQLTMLARGDPATSPRARSARRPRPVPPPPRARHP